MNRTQILLDVELKKALKARAEERHFSVSELIREVMHEHLARSDRQVGLRALVRMAKQAKKGGPTHLSTQVDETLYQL